jgi:DNA-binding transcriptional LysR family regulator
LAAPASIAIRLAIPTLPAFAGQHPDPRVDIAMGDHRQEPVQEAIDVAISLG